ncbi:hypothetical protein GCM10023221_26340 [Luteimicrobium xylanilyticum]
MPPTRTREEATHGTRSGTPVSFATTLTTIEGFDVKWGPITVRTRQAGCTKFRGCSIDGDREEAWWPDPHHRGRS